jgi:hypothetical protein
MLENLTPEIIRGLSLLRGSLRTSPGDLAETVAIISKTGDRSQQCASIVPKGRLLVSALILVIKMVMSDLEPFPSAARFQR